MILGILDHIEIELYCVVRKIADYSTWYTQEIKNIDLYCENFCDFSYCTIICFRECWFSLRSVRNGKCFVEIYVIKVVVNKELFVLYTFIDTVLSYWN